jgi:hypothetical protein
LGLCYGKVCCPSINMSQNKCYYYSVIASWPTSNSNYIASSFIYSSFTDIITTGYCCIWLNRGGAKYEIKSCNILRITQGSLDTHGTIFTSGNLEIKDSCILENKANRIFHQGSSSYTITLLNCTVDKTSNNGYLTIQNTVTKSFILGLNHISTRNCHSKYDSVGTLTPIIQSPSPSKKQIHCYTYMILYHPRLIDIFSLVSIFMFTFIHPGGFSYH